MKSISYILILVFMLSNLSFGDELRKRAHLHKERSLLAEDVETEISFGKELAVKIVGKYKLIKDEEKTKYINLLGRYIAKHGPRQELKYHFGILDTETVNAFSTPGGYVFITKGCLELVEDESELAGILAHEIAHITQMHIMKNINLRAKEKGKMGSLATIIKGPMGTVEDITLTLLDEAYKILFEKGYQLEQEYEADRVGTQLIYLSGYDPEGLKRFLKRVLEKGYGEQLEKTHPNISERINVLDEFLEKDNLKNLNLKRNRYRFERYIKKSLTKKE
ncbi:MAG: M48 family metalloprotease [Hydrogenothermaceae bacterium]|nr:M48 family metalloprotease [Hydrogenothermaceae bacterium]